MKTYVIVWTLLSTLNMFVTIKSYRSPPIAQAPHWARKVVVGFWTVMMTWGGTLWLGGYS